MPKEILHSTEGLSILGESESINQYIPSLLQTVAFRQPSWGAQEYQLPSLPCRSIEGIAALLGHLTRNP
jgi:hypothetical protein